MVIVKLKWQYYKDHVKVSVVDFTKSIDNTLQQLNHIN
jgi:hypothetical protein